MNKVTFACIVSTGLLLLSAPAFAAPESVVLNGEVKQDKVVNDNGMERHVLVTPEKVVPGDKLIFITNFANNGRQAVNNFVVTNPLPQGVIYSTDESTSAVVSVDGGKTWGPIDTLRVADGQGGERAAQATDVTHVRWTVAAIAPGGTGAVQYHGVVR